jgi:CRISPR type III-B/RAMP module-associated protein Cmr5
MVTVDVLKYSVECVKAVEEQYGKKGGVASKFRSRAREFAESFYYNDMTFMLTYIAAKSGENYLVGELIRNDVSDIVKEIKRIKTSDDEKSYGIYGAFLSKYIQLINVFEKSPNNLGDFLLAVQEKSLILTPYILEFAKWLKRLSEAKFEAE